MIFEYEVIIKEFHLDSFGHVNNATYLALYEEARWEVITKRGFGYQKIHDSGFGPVILDVNLRFIKELKLRDKIIITVETLSYEGKICKLRQQMIKENKEVASEALFTAAFFDLKERKLVLPTADWLYAVGINS